MCKLSIFYGQLNVYERQRQEKKKKKGKKSQTKKTTQMGKKTKVSQKTKHVSEKIQKKGSAVERHAMRVLI